MGSNGAQSLVDERPDLGSNLGNCRGWVGIMLLGFWFHRSSANFREWHQFAQMLLSLLVTRRVLRVREWLRVNVMVFQESKVSAPEVTKFRRTLLLL